MAERQIPLTLVDWLDDLCVRFLVNLPESELSSVPRLCFQVEEAQWYYEDFVRPAVQATGAPPLPSLTLRQFCLAIFQHCPMLSGFTDAQHIAAYEDFLAYKVRVPVRGAILLDQDMEKLVLVRGWKKGASWSFPRGKINKDEKDLDCAIREVYEETGYDLATSGLIPENENEAKYIDVTMREQHVRLFVFRGVPEDYQFETKTRKEISKIQWYWIKDLPGFKRQSKQQQSEAETTHANKFYMVAPFLGQLKKWIGQQKKKDEVEAQRRASAVHELPSMEHPIAIEDESEDHQAQENFGPVAGQREADLRRLLSIGAASDSPARSSIPDAHSGNLLAMLQGGGQHVNGGRPPITPFEQISAFPPQPETPQPHHLRQPSLGQQQVYPQPAPPQFPFAPQRIPQEQARNTPLPTPGVFGPGPSHVGFPANPSSGPASGMLPPYLQQQGFQQRPPMSNPTQFESQSRMPFNSSSGPPMQPPQTSLPPSFQNVLPPNAFMAQGPQGAIGSGPAVPNASQLPAPKLNQHTMKLLDAFKGGNAQPVPSAKPLNEAPPRHTSAHQAALLGLFKKPSISTPPAAQPNRSPVELEAASPTPSDATQKPGKPERKSTLNEITRTLPSMSKAKATPPPEATTAQPSIVPNIPVVERPKSRQLFDPSYPEKVSAGTPLMKQPANPASPVRILQRPSSQSDSKSPQSKQAAVAASPSSREMAVRENGQQSAPFTILARPGSSRGSVPPTPATPLKNATPPTTAFQPQLLKRPQGSEAEQAKSPAGGVDTKSNLLALFGKSPATAPATTATPLPQAVQEDNRRSQRAPTNGSQNALLDLFHTTSPPPAATSTSSPAPPPAPTLYPNSTRTAKASASASASTGGGGKKQQSLLLDLFNKTSNPNANTNASATSPGTPISPFTLGTPATTIAPSSLLASSSEGKAAAVTSPTASESRSGGSTPVEAKEFLMGYLNGVVRSEGFRGTGSKG